MLHSAHAPPARLAPFVQSLWIQEEPATPAGETVEPTVLLPVGHASLVLEYGDPYEELALDGTWRRLMPVVLAGPFTRPVRVRATGRTGLVIVPFHPWGASAFFGPQEESGERFTDLADALSPALAGRLEDEVRSAAGARARREVVERFLCARLAESRPSSRLDPRAAAAALRIERGGGRAPVEAVADELGVGRRHLLRLCERTLGLAPKAFARIVRFQHALRRARAGEAWAEVAAGAGFSDQAHLVKECVALAGCTPTALAAGIDERAVGRHFNDADPRLCRGTQYL